MDEENQAAPGDAGTSAEDALYRLLGGEPEADLTAEKRADKPPAEAAKEAAEAEPDDEATEDEKPSDDAAPEVFRVKVDGAEVEVTRDELLKGYSRQADYSKKTADLAAQRAQVEQTAQAFAAERQQYQAHLTQLSQALGLQLQEQETQTNWRELLDSNPAEYLKQRHLLEERQAAFQRATAATQRLSQEQAQQAQQSYHQRLAQEHQALLDKLPEWQDADKARTEKAALAAYMQKAGVSEDAAKSAAHHADLLVMARKAMLYDQAQTKTVEAVKKVQALPPKTLKPGVSEVSATDGRTRGMKALARSGSTDDAANVLMSLMGGGH